MSSWLLLLQFPLLYLPLVILGLGVYGSDFDVLSGRLFLGLIPTLALLDHFLGKWLERRAVGTLATVLLLLGVLAAGVAYRPLHLAYWDEHSSSQAATFVLLGLLSWSASRIGAGRLRLQPAPGKLGLAGALVLLGLAWWSAALYPMMPTLMLGAGLALAAALGPLTGEPRCVSAPRALVLPDRWWTWGALLLGIDAWTCVWDYQWVPAWSGQLMVLFVAAAVGLFASRRVGSLLLALGVLNFVLAALVRPWGIEPAHALFAGLALGVLLRRSLADDDGAAVGGRPLAGFSAYWVLGLVLGLALYQNLSFNALRLLVLAIPLTLFWREARRRSS